jgi:hypothetical protein
MQHGDAEHYRELAAHFRSLRPSPCPAFVGIYDSSPSSMTKPRIYMSR